MSNTKKKFKFMDSSKTKQKQKTNLFFLFSFILNDPYFIFINFLWFCLKKKEKFPLFSSSFFLLNINKTQLTVICALLLL